jgi:hypothetical protein
MYRRSRRFDRWGSRLQTGWGLFPSTYFLAFFLLGYRLLSTHYSLLSNLHFPTFSLRATGGRRPEVQVFFLLGPKPPKWSAIARPLPTFGQGGIQPPLPTSTI